MPSHVNLLNENNGQPTTPTPSPSEDSTLDKIECITCDSLDLYAELSKGYIEAVSLALYDPVLTVFASLVGLWVVVSGLQIWLAMVSPVHIMRDFLGIIIAFGLLTAQGGEFVSNIYESSLDLMGGAALIAFTVGPNAPPLESDGIRGMMEATENGVSTVFIAAYDVIADGNFLSPTSYLYAFLLVLPYFAVIALFFSKIVVSIFRLIMLGIFAPFLIMFFAFGWGRGMAIAGLKTLLAAIVVLFAAAASVGLLLYGVGIILGDGSSLGADGSDLLETKYLTLLILGWVGTALMTEGIGLANSITEATLSNVAAGIISAGIIGSGVAASSYAYKNPKTAAAFATSLGFGGGPLTELLGGAAALTSSGGQSVGQGVVRNAQAGAEGLGNISDSVRSASESSNSPGEAVGKVIGDGVRAIGKFYGKPNATTVD